jgi:hypothetical protein
MIADGLGWKWLTTTSVPHVCPSRTLEHVYIMRKVLDGEWKEADDGYPIILTGIAMFRFARASAWRME